MKAKMSLEDYLEYYEHRSRCALRRPHLNQILEMHGFLKLYTETKSLILHCLSSIELMPPSRPTLAESVSSCAFLSTADVAADIDALGWGECPVRSLLTFPSEAEQSCIAACGELPRIRPLFIPRRKRKRRFTTPPADFVIVGRRPRTRRKRVSINALTAALSSSSSAVAPVLPFPPLPPSPPPSSPPSPAFGYVWYG